MESKLLSFSYNNREAILDKVTLKIPQNKITAIIGPNGSGKSTLLSLLSKSIVPSSGKIYLEERNVDDFSPKEFSKRVALLSQHNTYPEHLTVGNFVCYGRLPFHRFRLQLSKREEEIVERALEQCELSDKKEKLLQYLSGGECQRTSIALALAQTPDYLLLDEPTTFLDIYHQLELLELIQQLKQQVTVVIVLHDINQALQISDQIIMMKNGKIVVQGMTKSIITESLIEEVFNVQGELFINKEQRLSFIPNTTVRKRVVSHDD